MLEIGRFTRDGEVYQGRLRTLSLDAAMRIEPMAKTAEKAPDYRVFADDVCCGVAWTPDAGPTVLNVKLDDPALAGAVRARLVAAEGGGFVLLWRRFVRD